MMQDGRSSSQMGPEMRPLSFFIDFSGVTSGRGAQLNYSQY